MSGKIDEKLFSHHTTTTEFCPKCKGDLQIRHGKHGPFWGCSNYPECDYINPLYHNDGHIVKELGIPCPACQKELVLRQGRYGMFIGCSGFPACEHIESLNPSPLIEKSESHGCPQCKKGSLIEKNSRYGKIFYACDAYPACKFAVNGAPITGECEACGFPLLTEKKSVSGNKLQCADRQCHHIQGDSIGEINEE